jgi:hypothetical protein
MEEIQTQKENLKKQQDEAMKKLQNDAIIQNQESLNQNKDITKDQLIADEKKEESKINKFLQSKKFTAEQMNKIIELQMKKNEAMVLNNRAVWEEEREGNDPEVGKKRKRENWLKKDAELKEELKFKGIDEKKLYLNQTAQNHEDYEQSKKKPKEVFGWNVFNDDTLYSAYFKRCSNIPFFKDVYDKQTASELDDGSGKQKPTEEMLNNLVEDIEKQAQKRKNFSRRRTFVEDQNITYINDRNRIYNKKLERHFGEYVGEIKSNLERGTAE